MKIAIISDMHLGYARFEQDSMDQAENAFMDANGKADIILCAGDVFDTKIPKLEAIKRAAEIFKKVNIPIFAIHGNHERRSKDMTNPVQLLAASGVVEYLHGNSKLFEKNGERIYVLGVGSVPEEYALEAIKKSIERNEIPKNAFRILMIHQTVSEIVPQGVCGIALDELETLPFDIIIDGHIHEKKIGMGGRFIIPGSTVVTQLKKEETEPRGYLLYDTVAKESEFVEISHRKFFFEEIKLDNAGIADAKNAIEEKIKEFRGKDANAIIRIKIGGTLKDGIGSRDVGQLSAIDDKLVFIDNEFGSENMKERIEKIKKSKDERLSVREVALKSLEESISGKISLFKVDEFFEKLCLGADEAEEYINGIKTAAANANTKN